MLNFQTQGVASAEECEQLPQNENFFAKTTFSSNLHQLTTEATKQVLATVGNAEFWKHTTRLVNAFSKFVLY